MTTITEIRTRALRSLIPPPRLRLSEWIEREIVLPEGTSTLPGRVRLWPYQREIADARRARRRRCREAEGISGGVIVSFPAA